MRRILFLTKWRWREAALSELKCWKWRVFVDPVQTVCPGAPSSPCLIGQRAAQSSAQEETGLDLLLLGMLPFLFFYFVKVGDRYLHHNTAACVSLRPQTQCLYVVRLCANRGEQGIVRIHFNKHFP